LANRLEEARTSAKLLEQVVGCTPPAEVLANELIKEFADRCLSASRSIQGYMSAEPAPDNDTMESLIDTNEQLQRSLNQHQRAVLQSKKHLGQGEPRTAPDFSPEVISVSHDEYRPEDLRANSGPPLPVRKTGKGKAAESSYAEAGPSRSDSNTPHHDNEDEANPFRDPLPESSMSGPRQQGGGAGRSSSDLSRLPHEPFHPGFSPVKNDPITPVSDDGYERDDRYRATPPKKTEHLYRY